MANDEENKRKAEKAQTQRLVHQLVQAIDNEPYRVNNYYDLGSFLTRLKDYEQAEELFMKALGVFDQRNDPDAMNLLRYGLGNVYYEAGEPDKALKEYGKIDDNHRKADAYLMMAQSMMKKHQYKQAVAFGLTAHDLRKQDPEIDEVLGDSLLALGEFKQAGKYYDAILKHHPGRADTQFNRGIVAMTQGEDPDDYFQQAQQLDPHYYEESTKRLKQIEATLKKQKDDSSDNSKH